MSYYVVFFAKKNENKTKKLNVIITRYDPSASQILYLVFLYLVAAIKVESSG